MKMKLSLPFAALAIACMPLAAQAQAGITDPTGDFLSTFGGSTSSTDLDVISATALYNTVTNVFELTGSFAGAVGSTASGFYVWGVNRGAGTAGFAANGFSGVRFDRVIIVRPDGSGTIGSTALPTGSVTITGNSITARVSGTLLPSTGFNFQDYTFNLWPRDGAQAGFAAISDFAPNNSNFTVSAVPEPQTLALMLTGLAMVGRLAKRRLSTPSA